MKDKQFNEMENWDKNTKKFFKKAMESWKMAGYSRKTSFAEAYEDTLNYLKEKHKWVKNKEK